MPRVGGLESEIRQGGWFLQIESARAALMVTRRVGVVTDAIGKTEHSGLCGGFWFSRLRGPILRIPIVLPPGPEE